MPFAFCTQAVVVGATMAMMMAMASRATHAEETVNSTATAEKESAQESPLAVTPAQQTAAWAVPWWMPRHKQKLADLKNMEEVNLLMIGDSITHSWEGAGKEVWNEYYRPRQAFNIGFSGDRTENVLWRLQNGAADGITPKVAVVMIGTNNTGHRQDPAEQTAAGIKAILDDLRQRLPETKVLLLAVFPRGTQADDKLRKLNDEINTIIANYHDGEHVFFLNINDTFLENDGRLPKSIMPDALHPNAEGYALWAKAMEPKLKELMDE